MVWQLRAPAMAAYQQPPSVGCGALQFCGGSDTFVFTRRPSQLVRRQTNPVARRKKRTLPL